MPYTTQRNSNYGGRVIVNKKSIAVLFKKDGPKATLPITAKDVLSVKPNDRIRGVGVVIYSDKDTSFLNIRFGDYAITLYLKKLIGNCDLMIVSRRGLRRAAHKALRMRRSK